MRRAVISLAAAAVLLGAANLAAQGTDFSGTWAPVVDPNAAGGGGGGGGGRGFGAGPMTIAQDAKTLTITRTQGGNEVKTVYNLDGSDSKNTMMGRGGNATEVVSHAKWDGAKLTITTPRTGQDGTVTTSTAVYSMEAGQLTVNTTAPGRDGTPATRTTTYKKG